MSSLACVALIVVCGARVSRISAKIYVDTEVRVQLFETRRIPSLSPGTICVDAVMWTTTEILLV